MTRICWRLWLLGPVAIFAVFVFAAACGDDDENGGTGQGGTVTFRSLQFQTWDPHFSNFGQDIDHFYMVWRGLYAINSDSEIVPAMAEGMPQVSDDGKTFTVKLEDELTWSDGQPLTAADFVLGLQRTCNPDVASPYQYLLSAVEGCDEYYGAADAQPAEKERLLAAVGVRAIDETTIEFKLGQPQATFGVMLALWPTFPAPKHKLATVDAAWPGPLENVYNGPFMPSAYTENDRMELVPNPEWSGKKPALAKIVLRYIESVAAADLAYRSGELDATLANVATLDALQRDSTLGKELFSVPTPSTFALVLNLTDPAFQKPEVRLALSQATNRQTLAGVVLKGAYTPTTHWIPAERSGAQEGAYDSALSYNVERARENMSKAGYPDGRGYGGFTLLLRDDPTNKLIGEFLQQAWKTELGIDVRLEFVDARTGGARFNGMEFQMVILSWNEDYPDAENWMLGLMETGGPINKTGLSIAAVDDLLAKARLNLDDDERRKQYRDAEKLVLEQANGWIPLYHVTNHFLVKPYVSGMTENSTLNDYLIPGARWPEEWSTSRR